MFSRRRRGGDVGELIPRGAEAGRRVEDADEEGEGEDHDVVEEARVVEGLGVDDRTIVPRAPKPTKASAGDQKQRGVVDRRRQ